MNTKVILFKVYQAFFFSVVKRWGFCSIYIYCKSNFLRYRCKLLLLSTSKKVMWGLYLCCKTSQFYHWCKAEEDAPEWPFIFNQNLHQFGQNLAFHLKIWQRQQKYTMSFEAIGQKLCPNPSVIHALVLSLWLQGGPPMKHSEPTPSLLTSVLNFVLGLHATSNVPNLKWT